MPRMIHELTEAREAEIRARAERARARAATAAPPQTEERCHPTRARALAAASRVGAPGTETGALQIGESSWVGTVLLRPDQLWMERHVRERGCRPVPMP